MIKRTKSYNTLRDQMQEVFDFAVVICHSVPALKLQIKLLEKGKIEKLPEPDYFTPNSAEQLKKQSKGYKSKLAT
ncbi:MAG: hypothetical protein ACQERC_09180 [Bacteroidota bacterium]